MNLEKLQAKLLAAGKAQPPTSDAPYAFANRVMASIRSQLPPVDPWRLWNTTLWRAAAPALAVMLATAAIVWLQPPTATDTDTLVSELEATVCAPLDASEDVW